MDIKLDTNIEAASTKAPLKLPWFPWIGKRPYYGWMIVIAGAFTQFNQGMLNQGFSSYLTPLQAEFGWSRTVMAGPRSVTQFENAILGPIEGSLIDRLGPRLMIALGTFIMGLGCILFGLTNSVLMFYLSNIIIAAGTGFQGLLVVSVSVNQWFRRKRSMAQALMGLGFTMAGIVGVPLLVLLQSNLGWRESAITNGLLIWAIGLPCSLLFRRSPEPYGLLPDGATPEELATPAAMRHAAAEYDFTLKQALRLRTFWLIAVGQALASFGMQGGGVHLFLHLEQGVGLSHESAALIWAIASTANIPARLIGGFFGDRLPKNFVLGTALTFMALSTLVLGLADSFVWAVGFAVLYGIGWGVRTPVSNAMQGEYFGRRFQGSISGWLSALTVPLTIFVPLGVGYIADVQHTYKWAFVGSAIVGMAGASLFFLATRPKPPAADTRQMAHE